MEQRWVTQTMIILITLLLLEPPLHHTVVHWNVSSSHRPRDIIIITSSTWHYHHHVVHVTLSSSYRPRDIIIITSSTWHYHHSTARYFKFKYRCRNLFLQLWKLLRILQNNVFIIKSMAETTMAELVYGRIGIWTNWFMANHSEEIKISES